MRKTLATCAAAVLICSTLAFGAEPAAKSGSPKLSPPARPAALTASQYSALQSLQAAPEHSKVLGTSATYSAREESLKFTRFSDDMWTVIYDVGWPGTFLGVALCAL